MFDIFYAIFWNGQLWFFSDEPVFWDGMCDTVVIMPLCHDDEYY